MFVSCSNHLHALQESDSLEEAVRTQQCDGLCWCTARATSTLYINSPACENRLSNNNGIDYVGVLLGSLGSLNSFCLAGGSDATATMLWFTLVYC